MSDQIDFILRQIPNLLVGFPNNRPGGLLLSVLLSAGTIAVGFLLATALGFAHHSRWAVLRFLAGRFVWLIRGIPLIVLLVLLFQLLGTGIIFGLELSAFWAAVVTLILYAGAYQGDIVRAGIAAVPAQLIDDARLLGASRVTVARTVTVPYALRVMRPALVTQAITIFKDSSVVVVLGVVDLTTTARIALGSDIQNAPFWVATYLTVGAMYWVVAYGLAKAVRPRRGPRLAPEVAIS